MKILKFLFPKRCKKEPSEEPEIVNFSKADWPFIKTGMFCFTDNTFSRHLQEGKVVRGIVIKKTKKNIYVLLPKEQHLPYSKERDYREFIERIIFKDNQMVCTKKIPEISLWDNMNWSIDVINTALKEAKQPELKGFYWSWCNGYLHFIYDINKGQKHLIGQNCSATARFIIEMRRK